jgi:4-hydroxy-tetrahydrodipicolinate synthase
MVRQFFVALDRRLEIDIVFYDNPLYTKTPLRVDELARLIADCPHLAAVKMTDNNIDKIPPLIQETGTTVFVGDDVVAFRSLLLGCAGSMIIAPSVFPEAYQEVCRLLAAGQTRAAFHRFSRSILPFIHLFGLGDEIVNTKALFHHLGLFRSPETRLPLVPPTEERVREVILAYEECRGA